MTTDSDTPTTASPGAEVPASPPLADVPQPEAAPAAPEAEAPGDAAPLTETASSTPTVVAEVEPPTVLPSFVQPPVPEVYDGETFVITSNSGRTRITVRLEPEVMGADAEGNPVVLRTGEGNVSAERDGRNILAFPLMREQAL